MRKLALVALLLLAACDEGESITGPLEGHCVIDPAKIAAMPAHWSNPFHGVPLDSLRTLCR